MRVTYVVVVIQCPGKPPVRVPFDDHQEAVLMAEKWRRLGCDVAIEEEGHLL